ncbi:phosphoprotein [Alston virus]|uniref:Phosphoprotein n=1 Tax=Alston virus TaxID=2495433 RepID=A0A3S8RK56_9MONO|nr:phosphoprotein [Alston virus]AZK31323.1 phosphoprotein [Alston virus]
MDPTDLSFSSEEINKLIETGLNTVEYFTSQQVTGQSSLGKNSIPPGVTGILTNAAEAKIQESIAPIKPGTGGGARPKKARPKIAIVPADDKTVPGKPIPNPLLGLDSTPSTQSVLDLSGKTHPTGSYKGVTLAKFGKENLMTRFMEEPRESPIATSSPVDFKRGAGVPVVTIEGNTLSDGWEMKSKSQSGAIHPAPQSQQQQGDLNALVTSVQSLALNVSEILNTVRGMDTRLNQIESKVDRIMSSQSLLQTMKNDIIGLKAGMATLEGMITTVKIMDPGVPSNVTVEDVRKTLSNHAVVVPESFNDSFLTQSEDVLSLDDLARPTATNVKKIVRKVPPPKDLTGLKITLEQLAKDCISKPKAREEFLIKINQATSESQLHDLKKSIIRSAI